MKVAFIGTGLMGRPMAERLLAAGYQVSVFNRSMEKAESLRSAGAEIAPSVAEAIQSANCLVLMLADAAAIRQVIFDTRPRPELKDLTVIQMGTISPSESIAFQDEVRERGGDYLEAPVLGSIPEVSAGNLLVMVGGSKMQFDRWSDLLQVFGPHPLIIGEVGKASALKLAMNQLIASLTAGFALSLGFVQRYDIAVDLFMKILRQSALYAPTFDKKLQRMLNRDYTRPNFPGKHLFKDVGLFRTAAQTENLETIGVEAIHRLLEITLEKGYSEGDYSALFEAVNPVQQQAGGS
jgi:3-hydroxyisobutyrate dehydrogenase